MTRLFGPYIDTECSESVSALVDKVMKCFSLRITDYINQDEWSLEDLQRLKADDLNLHARGVYLLVCMMVYGGSSRDMAERLLGGSGHMDCIEAAHEGTRFFNLADFLA